MNDELERMWKEAVKAREGTVPNFLEDTGGKHENISQSNRSTGRDLKAGPPESEAEVLKQSTTTFGKRIMLN
jgi:hypothetical protein